MSPSREGMSGLAHGALVVHVWIVAAVIPPLDKFLTLERMLRLLTPHRPLHLYAGVTADLIVGIVRRRLHRPFHMRRRACLRLSLVMYHFARLAGIDAVFHVAVFPPSADPNRLHAHSWVTAGEVCLCEPPKGHAAEVLTYGMEGSLRPGCGGRASDRGSSQRHNC